MTLGTNHFGSLFIRHNDRLTRYLQRLSGCRPVAEDVAQQAWIKLLDAAARGTTLPTDEAEFRALLFTAARNTFIDSYQRRHFEARTVRLEPAALERVHRGDAVAPPCEQELERAELGRLVQQAIAALPPAQRHAVVMWQAGLPVAAMADRANVPRDTVLSRKKYAFAKLRASLRGFAPCALTQGSGEFDAGRPEELHAVEA
jgi:RNA polymerase sigma-70 factor, ECF subfamily